MDIAYLKRCDLNRLEALYKQPGEISIPESGSYKGVYLKRLDNPGANKMINRITLWAMFDLMPFGLNFYPEYGDWYFFYPSLATGRFLPSVGPSRWRQAETIRLNYHVSGLPKLIRSILYDEIKPVAEDLLLGIGGFNAEKGAGEQFFFAIERI